MLKTPSSNSNRVISYVSFKMKHISPAHIIVLGCFFQNVIFYVVQFSKQLKTAQLSFYVQMLYFIILNQFQQIKYKIMLK